MHDEKRNHLAALPTARYTCPMEVTQRVDTCRTSTVLIQVNSDKSPREVAREEDARRQKGLQYVGVVMNSDFTAELADDTTSSGLRRCVRVALSDLSSLPCVQTLLAQAPVKLNNFLLDVPPNILVENKFLRSAIQIKTASKVHISLLACVLHTSPIAC